MFSLKYGLIVDKKKILNKKKGKKKSQQWPGVELGTLALMVGGSFIRTTNAQEFSKLVKVQG